MIKKVILPLLLSLGLGLTSSLAAGTMPVYAEETKTDNTGDGAAKDSETKDSGIETSKTVKYNEDEDSYTITLEAFATGEKTTSTVTKDVPTDIILVLDLSSSMKEDIGTVTYQAYTNSKTNEDLYALRHNGGEGNLWYKPNEEESKYYSVSVTVTGETPNYTDASSYSNSRLYSYYQNNLYAKIDDKCVKVTVARSGEQWSYTYTYTYDDKTVTSTGSSGKPTFDDGATLCVLTSTDSTNAVYTYVYTDSNNTEHTITTSTGGTESPITQFYSRTTSTSGGGTRLAALKTACTNFADAVAKKCTTAAGETVKHRIAVVGFNSSSARYTGTSDATALIDMSTSADTVKNAITKLGTSQGTVPATGLTTANGIFKANPVSDGETRNRVVILFTDGYPSTSGSSNFDKTLADNAIAQANTAKNNYGATVYTVAVIAGADPTSAGNKDGTNQEKVNWYLQSASSNNGTPKTPSYYLSASDAASLNDIFQQISQQIETGGSSSTLTGESVVKDIISPYFTLPERATADDITLKTYKYNGPSFDAATAWTENTGDAKGAKVTIDGDKVSVTGFNFSENWCGTESKTGTVGDVTYRGNKLVIEFKVKAKDAFLGGNSVPTNGDTSGVYENKDATDAVEKFDVPVVNVPIKAINVTAEDKNVYLTGSVTLDQLKKGATVTVGKTETLAGVTLDLSKASDTDKPYGIEKWQSEYVDISVAIKDKDGKEIKNTDLQSLTDDQQYQIVVTISPKDEAKSGVPGPAAKETSNEDGKANINVFKPSLTFKDGTAYYGDSVPTDNDYSANKETEEWTHTVDQTTKKDTDTDVTMIPYSETEEKPELAITYTPVETVDGVVYISDGNYGKNDGVRVNAAVKIGTTDVTEQTSFTHTACAEGSGCGWDAIADKKAGTPAFLIHIRTCSLTVTKAGDSSLDNGSYVFDVYKDNVKYSEVSIQGNSSQTLTELPVGTYTIKENTGWSWRYSGSPSYDKASVALSSSNTSGAITCKNTREKTSWLDGYSTIVRNIYGKSSSTDSSNN
jgi:hypothetical protein